MPDKSAKGIDRRELIMASVATLGAAATFLVFDGLSTSTLGASFTQVVFSFRLTPLLVAEGLVLALLVGLTRQV